jgi:hypothetical protein
MFVIYFYVDLFFFSPFYWAVPEFRPHLMRAKGFAGLRRTAERLHLKPVAELPGGDVLKRFFS